MKTLDLKEYGQVKEVKKIIVKVDGLANCMNSQIVHFDYDSTGMVVGFDGPLTESILKRAADGGLISVRCHNIRDYATDKHRSADDAPYGGGTGMIMKVEPLAGCIDAVKSERPQSKVILTTPRGRTFSQQVAREFAEESGLIIICGRYEGVDERVSSLYVDHEISLGDFVLTGGELAAIGS